MNKEELQQCAAAGCSNGRYQGKLFCRSHQRSFVLYGDPLKRLHNKKPVTGLTNRGYDPVKKKAAYELKKLSKKAQPILEAA